MSKALTKKKETALATESDLNFDGMDLGYEDFDPSDLPTPRLRLLQAMSEACQDGKGIAGQFENNLTGEILDAGEEFVFLKATPGAVLMSEDDGLICKSVDGHHSTKGAECVKCPHDSYHKDWDNGAPACQSTIDAVAIRRSSILSGDPELVMVSFKSTSYTAGRTIIANASARRKPLFAFSYALNVKKKEAKKGKFFVMDPKSEGFITAEEFETLKPIIESFKTRVIEETEKPKEEVNDF